MKTKKLRKLRRNNRAEYRAKYRGAVVVLLLIGAIIGYMGYQSKQASLAYAKADVYKSELEQQRQQNSNLIAENAIIKQQLALKVDVDKKIANSPEVKARALQAAATKFGYGEVEAFEKLINRESGFNLFALNKSSGSCGLFQALPCNKLPGFDLDSQLKWGLNYIESRYGKPSLALQFHYQNGWY